MATRFDKDNSFEGAIRRQAEYVAHMKLVGNAVAASVVANAPRTTGYYRRSIKVTASGDAVYSADSFAHLIEWGSVNNPPYGPMRRGVLALGMRFDPSAI